MSAATRLPTALEAHRVILADDHRIFLEGLEKLLRADFEVVAAVADGSALVRAAVDKRPDVIIADYSMPGMNGLEAVAAARAAGVTCPVVILTMHHDPEYAEAALAAGIQGYVLKQAASSELIGAVHAVLEGNVWLSPAIAGDVLQMARSAGERTWRPTHRQHEILALLVRGKIAKEIANELGISRRTVEYHKYKLMRELGLGTTAELIQFAVRKGLDEPPD